MLFIFFYIMFLMNLYVFVRLYTPTVYTKIRKAIAFANIMWAVLRLTGVRKSWVKILILVFMVKTQKKIFKAQTLWRQYWYHTVTTLPNNRLKLSHYINGTLVHIIVRPNNQLDNISNILDPNETPILCEIKPFISYIQDKIHPEDIQLQTPLSIVYSNPELEPIDLLSEVAF